MDAVLLSRIQFAVTIGFHFIFAPLTIGLSWFIAWLTNRYRKTGDPLHRQLARFWTSVFALSFAVGVATGITMEFQFGTNWSKYSRFVGDIFGAPLAAEGIFAFFLESTFLGVMLFGWDRVSRKVQAFAALMVAVGSTLSAFWILAANSWMQTPTDYILRNNRAELTNFWGAVFNLSTIPRFLHTVDAALMTGALFMMGISAWYLLKGRHVEASRLTLTVSLAVAFVTALLQLVTGHYHAIQVAFTQPAKLAAIEGVYATQSHAPLLVFGIPDTEHETMRYAIRLPGALSFAAFGNSSAVVKGLDAYPKDQRPYVPLTFYPFHLMVALGMFFILFTAVGIFLRWRKKLFTYRPYLILSLLVIPLPFLANELGWMTAEVGRQPWIVYNVLRTGDAISITVPVAQILASLIIFSLIYTLLFIIWIAFLRRAINRRPEDTSTLPKTEAA